MNVVDLARKHNGYRESCANLIASENVTSPAVEEAYGLGKDLGHRYAEGENEVAGHPVSRHYQGQRYIKQVEAATADLLHEVFGTDFVEPRAISGCNANQAAFRGLTDLSHKSMMMAVALPSGGHISHDYAGLAGQMIGLQTANFAYDEEAMNIDVEGSKEIIRATKPGFVVFGASLFPFPHPIEELAPVAREVGAFVVYDAAHVLGLVAGGQFQQPLDHVDFVTASTHKTFPGPQGGVILGRVKGDERLERAARGIQRAVFPKSVSNHHLRRFPALGVTALEMLEFGEGYASMVVNNAKAAAETLHDEGLNVLGEDLGFTESHQVVVDVRELGGGAEVAERLEEARIILNKNLLPYDELGEEADPSGIRIGFQEVTRLGFDVADTRYLCRLLVRALRGEPSAVKEEVTEFVKDRDVRYGFSSLEEAEAHLPAPD